VEGFAHGLPARNVRMFRHGPAPAVGTLLSRGMAVDNLWITMGLINMPHKRVLRTFDGVWGRAYTYPLPHPRSSIVARLWGIGGDSPDEENPRFPGAKEKPHGVTSVACMVA
jgi:hypothetical protein